MKNLFRISVILILVFFVSCFGKKNDTNTRFEAETLRGQTVVFRHAESGMVSISEKGIKRMSAIDSNGTPIYATKDIADVFIAGKKVVLKERNGICVRFRVPRINDNDYLILNAQTRLPRQVKLNGEKVSSLDASYRYDSRY
ncbi:MAG TPA: hypothetical protein VF857_00755, partial [Spirochaetota bacterium]